MLEPLLLGELTTSGDCSREGGSGARGRGIQSAVEHTYQQSENKGSYLARF